MRQSLRIISNMKTRLSSHLGGICLLLLSLCFILPAPSYALTVENISFADSTAIGGKPVPLSNAALLRYLKFIKAYVAALYLPEGVKAEDVLSDVPKRLEISYLVSIKGPVLTRVPRRSWNATRHRRNVPGFRGESTRSMPPIRTSNLEIATS